jgi:hypothetical protein
MIRETFAYRMIRSQSTFPFIIPRLLYIIDSGAYFIFSSPSQGSGEGTKKASDSTLQADAEDSCNNETESPNVPEDPKKNNPKDEFETAKTPKSSDSQLRKQTPIYPHTPVKVYNNAKESKSDIVRDFKKKTVIYMWVNNITGKVYIGSGIDGSSRLSRYYLPSVLKSNSRIYKSILKYGHDSFSVIILEVVGDSNSVSKAHCLAREQFYLDWALRTYGLLVLNLLHETSSSLGFKHSLETKKRISAIRTGSKHSVTTIENLRERFSGEKNPF